MAPLSHSSVPVFGDWSAQLVHHPPRQRPIAIGLALSLLFALLTGLYVIANAYNNPLVVQDDARQHVFWMARFLNAEMFPNDPIADYFQAVSPIGYTALYRMAAWVGIPPFAFNTVLPVGIALTTTAVVYGLTLELLPLPIAGFLATAILNLSLWMKDDLASGTPRAFVYLMLALFLYGAVRRWWWWAAIATVLTASFYPQYVVVEGTIAFLGGLAALFPRWSRRFGLSVAAPDALPASRRVDGFWLSLWAVAIAAVLAYIATTSDYGPTITVEQAQQSAEFWPRGRSRFFDDDPVRFWLTGSRSGFFPDRTPLFLWCGALLPLTLKCPRWFPLAAALDRRAVLLNRWWMSSVGLFVLAHGLLFRLHLPSRYAHHNLKLLLAIAAGIALTLWADGLWRWAQHVWERALWPGLAVGCSLLGFALLGWVAASPLWLADAFHPAYKTGKVPSVYSFLQSTPIDTKLAGIDRELDNLPTFAQRSIVFGFEYAIPYQLGYAEPMKQRGVDTIATVFSDDRQAVADFVQRYDLDLWLVRRSSFSANGIREDQRLGKTVKSKLQADPLVQAIATAITDLEAGRTPVLATDLDRCAAFTDGDFVVLDAACTAQAPST